jgi:hypothetical protein
MWLDNFMRLRWALFILPILTLAVAACNESTPPPTATPTAAVVESAAAPAAALTTTATAGAAAPAQSPLTVTQPATTTEPVEAATQHSTPDGSLPTLLAEIPLGGPDDLLIDLRLDRAANRLYVSDSGGQLHVLDATTYQILATLPVAGELILDPGRSRLFVAPASLYYQPEAQISVVDTDSLAISGTIPNATHLALDAANNRLFVGRRLSSPAAQDELPVRQLDGATLQTVAQLPRPGIPVYNPLRNELLIVAHTVYAVDLAGDGTVVDLLPELSATACPDCVGGQRVEGAYIFPEQNLLALDVQTISTAGGPGYVAAPRFYDATTLTPVTMPPQPALQTLCGSEQALQPVVDGRVYRTDLYARYLTYVNLLVEAEDGGVITWRDGIARPFVNPNTGQFYAGGWIYDLATLQPLGGLPPDFCLLHHDANQGLLLGRRHGVLAILAEGGATPSTEANQAVASLPSGAISQILVSPDFATDATLFVVSGNSTLYRSTDGGASWAHLRAGLLLDGVGIMTLAMSPAFGQDQTLFAGGYWQQTLGGGIFRSTDRGESWSPIWNNLIHLRIEEILLSPAYAADQTLAAYAEYQRVQPWEGGQSLQLSTDGGLSWTIALTATDEISPSVRRELVGIPPVDLPVRLADFGRSLERRVAGGAWAPVALAQPESGTLVTLIPGPAVEPAGEPGADDAYLLGTHGLWRVRERGATIEQWSDPRLDGRTYTNTLTALALSPPLANGSRRLLVGSAAGELWTLDPATLAWTPVITPAGDDISPAAAVTATPAIAEVLPPLPAEPPAGLYRPTGTFEPIWSSKADLQRRLGWALTPAATGVPAAYQTFEQGVMIWQGDEARIYALASNGSWRGFADTFREGDPESDPSLSAPQGRLQPVRGFGKIWRTEPEVRSQLGWATDRESGLTAQVQRFERGTLIWVSGLIYALIETPDGQQVWVVA